MEDINFKRESNPVMKQLEEIKNKKKGKIKKTKKKIKKKIEKISGFVSNGYIGEMVLNKIRKRYCFAIYHCSEKHLTYEDYIDLGNKIYIPDTGNGLIAGNVIRIPKCPEKYGDKFHLKEDLRNYLNKYIDIQDELDREIIITYILLTWVYDRFSAIPYLRIIGDMGSGKTRLLKVLKVCYRSLLTSCLASPAPLFRLIHRYSCTLLLDEADLQEKDERNVLIREMLRAGKDSDGFVLRCSENNPNNIDSFRVFGPKVLGSRRSTGDDALESRVISIRMQETKSDRIPLHLDNEELEKDSERIRAKLLAYRFKNYFKIDINAYKKYIESGVFKRLNEMMSPLICIRQNDEDFIEKLIEKTREKHEQIMEDKSMSLDALIISEIFTKYRESKTGYILIQDITESINEKMKNKNYHSRFIGNIVRDNFKLKTQRTRYGNKLIYEDVKVQRLIKEYNLTKILGVKGYEEAGKSINKMFKAKGLNL